MRKELDDLLTITEKSLNGKWITNFMDSFTQYTFADGKVTTYGSSPGITNVPISFESADNTKQFKIQNRKITLELLSAKFLIWQEEIEREEGEEGEEGEERQIRYSLLVKAQ